MASKRLDAGKLVRAAAREHIGTVPTTRTIPNKKKNLKLKYKPDWHKEREENTSGSFCVWGRVQAGERGADRVA